MNSNSERSCKMCNNVPRKNAIMKINSLPKIFTIILEEMSGLKFSKKEDNLIICMKCNNYLKNMDTSSNIPKSNKLSEEGKKRVFRLMEKKRFPAVEAIETVLAEQRAKELLVEAGLKAKGPDGNLIPIEQPKIRHRLSGSQRKKASILIDAGMDPEAARQLIIASVIAAKQTDPMGTIYDQWSDVGQKMSKQNNAKSPLPQKAAAQKNKLPQGNVAQTGKPKAIPTPPVQRVAPVKVVPGKAGPGPKGPNQNVPATKKPTTSSGILIPQNKKQNNNVGGGRGSNSDKRVGPIVTPRRRNDRPAPYNVNRQQNLQNQSQMQNSNFNQSRTQNNNFNQRQQQINSFEVGIVPINYPNVSLDDLKLDALKEAITNEILKIPQGGPLIRFLGTSSQNGWLKIICADELSLNWLSMLVSRWERAGVRMVEGNAMPQPEILSFFLQGDFRSPDEILSIIEKQNNGLNANQWRVINRESDRNGQRITICVDEQCFQALRSRDFMVFLGLGVVELKLRRPLSDDISFSNNLSSQDFMGNDNGNFMNSSGNNMQGGRGGGMGNMAGNNYQSNSGRGSGNGGGGNNFQNQGQGYQRGGGYQSQRAW